MPQLLSLEGGNKEKSIITNSNSFSMVTILYKADSDLDMVSMLQSGQDPKFMVGGTELDESQKRAFLVEWFTERGYDVFEGGPDGDFGRRGIGVWDDAWVARLPGHGEEYYFYGGNIAQEGSGEYAYLRLCFAALDNMLENERQPPQEGEIRSMQVGFDYGKIMLNYAYAEGGESDRLAPFRNAVSVTMENGEAVQTEHAQAALMQYFSVNGYEVVAGSALGEYGVGQEFWVARKEGETLIFQGTKLLGEESENIRAWVGAALHRYDYSIGH
jgi:hypothetical protein